MNTQLMQQIARDRSHARRQEAARYRLTRRRAPRRAEPARTSWLSRRHVAVRPAPG